MRIDKEHLSPSEYREITRLLSYSENDPLQFEDIWRMIDIVWDELGCDNANVDLLKFEEYYRHPVWILNAIFIENNELSLQHRHAICDWICRRQLYQILDFGGGMGSLAKIIAREKPGVEVDIYEPHPSRYALKKIKEFKNIRFVHSLDKSYDCLISTDVLEHVVDPLGQMGQMVSSVRLEGFLLIANHFFPTIKCHLPSTFHLRYTFGSFAKKMGLKDLGICRGSHATIYQKEKEKPFDWAVLRQMEHRSKSRLPWHQFKHDHIFPWKCRFLNLCQDPANSLKKINAKFVGRSSKR